MVLVERIRKNALYTKDVQLYLNPINAQMVLVQILKKNVILPLLTVRMKLYYARMDYVERNAQNLMDARMKSP
jgi:hypothetical protein